MVHTARKGQQSGGIAVVHKNYLKVSKQTMTVYETFECIEVLLQTENDTFVCTVPSPFKSQFIDEFTTYMYKQATASGKLLVLGDFNIHVEDLSDLPARKFRELLCSLNLDQHVNEPTHEKGHVLDLLLTRSNEIILSKIDIIPCGFSDHYVISFCISEKRPKWETKQDQST